MIGNTTATSTTPNNTFVKISGTTSDLKLLKFESDANNRLRYKGNEDIVANVFISIKGTSPANSAGFTIAIYKNGAAGTNSYSSTGTTVNNQAFILVSETQVDMSADDYIEADIKTTSSDSPIIIFDIQFRARD